MKLEGRTKKRLALWLACAVLVFASLLPFTTVVAVPEPGVAGPEEFTLSEQDDGRQVELREGQILAIGLQGNPSTGYQWQVAEIDEAIVREVGEIEFKPESDLLGAPATMTRRFQAVGPGQAELVLVYRRPWEDGEPAGTFSVQVQGVGSFSEVGTLPAPDPIPVSAPNGEDLAPTAARSTQTLPSYFNWCDSGGCTPVKNQGNCGSCWAFATVGPFESLIKLNDGVTKDLAEQYLVSCNNDGWGCNGGWWAHDYHEWKIPSGESAAGAVYEADFPYTSGSTGATGPCTGQPHTHHEKITDWDFVGSSYGVPPVASIKQAIYDRGPLTVAICVNGAFQGYSGGVFTGPSCSDINHGVVLVGWDDSKGTSGAWRLRNSWGSGWGESGYMWIKYGVSSVGYAANYVVYEGSAPLPNAPSSLLATGVSKTRINLQWTDNSSNETGFKIERSPNGSTGWAQIATVGANVTTYSNAGLPPNTTYYYRVQAYNTVGDSGYSNVAHATTLSGSMFNAYLPLVLGSYGTGGSAITNGDFEDGSTGWTEYSSHGWPLIINSGFPSGVAPHGGSWAVWLGGDNNELAYIQQQVTIPASKPYLHYWHWIDSADDCGWDFASVRINNVAVEVYDLCLARNTGGWVEHVVDLGAYGGQSVSLQLRVQTDTWVNSNLFVDDLSLQAVASAEPAGPGATDAEVARPRSRKE